MKNPGSNGVESGRTETVIASVKPFCTQPIIPLYFPVVQLVTTPEPSSPQSVGTNLLYGKNECS